MLEEDDNSKLKVSLMSVVKRRIVKWKQWNKVYLVFTPTGESVSNMNELWGKLKNSKELYDKIQMDTALQGEKQEDFEMRAFQILISREFDDDVEFEENNVVERSVRSYQCHVCPKKFARKDHFENHKLLHDDSAPICITCKKKFKSNLALSKHLCNGGFCPLQCILCTRTFVKKCHLDKHLNVCHGDEDDVGGTCELCLKTFKYRIELERHRKGYTNIDGSFKFACGYCEKKHCNSEMLGNHIKSDSELCDSSKKETILCKNVYPCEKCGKQFTSKALMMTHLELHTEIKEKTKSIQEFKCNLCSQKFSLFKNYERHRRQVYAHDDSPRNLCAKCGKIFCTSRLLKRHLNVSHAVSCSTCDESFTTKRALDHHIQKKSSFTCVECQKIFCNKKAFVVHMSYVHHKYVKL